MTKFALVFALAAVVLVVAQKGVKIAISENACEYVKTVLIPFAEKELMNTQIPDIFGITSTPVGDIHYRLQQIHITTFSVAASDVQLKAPHSLALVVSSVALSLHLDWHFTFTWWPHPGDGGNADVDANNVNSNINIVYGIDSTGRPTAQVDSCSFAIGHFDIHLHGGASWLLQIFVDIFAGQIRDSVVSALQQNIPSAINDLLSKSLSTLPLVEKIMPDIEVDYTFEEAPFVQNNMLLASAKGELYAINDHKETPGQPINMPDQVNTQMLQIMVSEWSADSVGYAFTLGNYMDLTLMRDNSSADMATIFNASTIGQGVPALQEIYPNALLYFNMISPTAPQTIWSATDPNFNAIVTGDLTVFAQNAQTGKFDNAFELEVKLTLGGQINIDSKQVKITAILEVIESSMTQLSSNIGPIDCDNLNDLLDFVADSSLDQINEVLGKGFQLPTMDGVSLVNPSVAFADHYIVVSSDINYSPNP